MVTRLVNRPIVIEAWQNDIPTAFRDGTVLHRVDTYIDIWVETGYWWKGEGARQMLRVYTHLQHIFDLEGSGSNWSIYKVWD